MEYSSKNKSFSASFFSSSLISEKREVLDVSGRILQCLSGAAVLFEWEFPTGKASLCANKLSNRTNRNVIVESIFVSLFLCVSLLIDSSNAYEIIDSFIDAQLVMTTTCEFCFVHYLNFRGNRKLDGRARSEGNGIADVVLFRNSVGAGTPHDSIYFDSWKR